MMQTTQAHRGLALALLLGSGAACSGDPPAVPEPGPTRDPVKEWYGDPSAACLPAGCNVTPVEIAAGYQHSCARMQDGSIRCWGLDDYGQLAGSSMAKPIEGLSDAVRIGAGNTYSCAIIRGGSVKCWGMLPLDGMKGEPFSPMTTVSPRPAEVTALANQPAGQLITRGSVACTILATDEARAVCWGTSSYLGTALFVYANVPPSLINVRLLNMTYSFYSYGLVHFDGTGNTCDSQDQRPCIVPLGQRTDITQIARGNHYGFVLLRDRTVHAYGRSQFVPCSSAPTNLGYQAAPASHCKYMTDSAWVDPDPWPGLSDIVDLQVSQPLRRPNASAHEPELAFTCALQQDGEVLCWGNNNYGQRGTGEVEEKGYPYPPPTAELTSVPGLHNVTQLSIGSAHACALTSKREVYCWGQNGAEMRLGDRRKSGAPPTEPIHFAP